MLAVTPIVVIGMRSYPLLLHSLHYTYAVAVAYGKSIKSLAKERQDSLAKATDSADESIANIRTGTDSIHTLRILTNIYCDSEIILR